MERERQECETKGKTIIAVIIKGTEKVMGRRNYCGREKHRGIESEIRNKCRYLKNF